MSQEALRNKEIAEQNAKTLAANVLAQDQANAAVAASNQQKIQLATVIADNAVRAEYQQKANDLVVPTLLQIIQRARELSMNVPETL